MSSTEARPAAPLPPPPAYFRWSVLVLASLAMAGNYYVYDSISPLADILVSQLGFSADNIGTLNGIYSLPNIFMVLIGGLIIDRIGTRKSTVIFGALCFAGAVITAATSNFYVMAAGRLTFGLGAESLIVAVTAALAKWFRGKELSFAFGINLTIARLGSFAALNSPTWARPAYGDWRAPLLIAAGVGMLCIVGSILYYGMEVGGERRYSLGKASEPDKIVLKDIVRFGASYWFVVAMCVTFYSAIFPFQTFAVMFFQDVHHLSREAGGGLSSMLTLFAMVFTPLFGLLVDRIGKRATLMIYGSVLLLPVYLIMAYVPMPPLGADFTLALGPIDLVTLPRSLLIVPMALMGIAFSLIPAVMWPSVAYLVDQSKLGTGLGLMTMIQNIGLSGANFLMGWANEASHASAENSAGYVPMMGIFTGFVGLAILFAFILRRAETGPRARGLETITVKSQQAQERGKAEAAAASSSTPAAKPVDHEDDDF
jgi:MFS family permease